MKVRMHTSTPLGRKGHGNAASHSGDLKKCFTQLPGCTLRLSNGPIHSFILVCLFVYLPHMSSVGQQYLEMLIGNFDICLTLLVF